MRMILVLFAALIVAGSTGFYLLHARDAQRAFEAPQALVEAPAAIDVFVPAAQVAVGTILKPEHLGRMPIDEGAITAEMIAADEAGVATLVGSVARQTLPQGVPIARSAVVQPGERGFLAAVLPKGKRAISIPISETAGLSGLVLPGDRVDIILTYSVLGSLIDTERDIRASETVMTNLRVLALDQRLSARDGTNPIEGQPVARNATLEVTSQQAEMLTLATQLGGLSLVLNSVRDGGEPGEMLVEDAAADAATPLLAEAALRPSRLAAIQDLGLGAARGLTLDSDVTSLLRREAAMAERRMLEGERGDEGSVPAVDRISRVQVVRGIATGSVEFAPLKPLDAAGGLDAGAAPYVAADAVPLAAD